MMDRPAKRDSQRTRMASGSVRILDVTLREAGMINGYTFPLGVVGEVVSALDAGGVDVIEIGYFRPRLALDTGAACGAGYLRVVDPEARTAQISVMVHAPDVAMGDYVQLADAGVSLVRMVSAADRVHDLAPHADAIINAGLALTINATRTTEASPEAVVAAAATATSLGAKCFYVADSNGAMYPSDAFSIIRRLCDKASIPIGFHAHDNLRLAFANTLSALEAGALWVDASLGGAGKNGNLIMELLAGHLAMNAGRRLDMFALADAYHRLVTPFLPSAPDGEFCASVFGLMNMNLDHITTLVREANQTARPVRELLAPMFAGRTATTTDGLSV